MRVPDRAHPDHETKPTPELATINERHKRIPSLLSEHRVRDFAKKSLEMIKSFGFIMGKETLSENDFNKKIIDMESMFLPTGTPSTVPYRRIVRKNYRTAYRMWSPLFNKTIRERDEWVTLSWELIKNALRDNYGYPYLEDHDEIFVESGRLTEVYQSTDDLIHSGQAIVKLISATPNNNGNIDFNINQLKDTVYERPFRYRSDYNRRYIRDPRIGRVTNPRQIKQQGQPKNTRYTKKTSVTLLPRHGVIKLYSRVSFPVGLMYDINECHLKDERYVWEQNAYTVNRWWLGTDGSEHYQSISIDELQRKINVNTLLNHNEILAGLSRESVTAVFATSNSIWDRLNAMRIKLKLLVELNIDVPVIIYDQPTDDCLLPTPRTEYNLSNLLLDFVICDYSNPTLLSLTSEIVSLQLECGLLDFTSAELQYMINKWPTQAISEITMLRLLDFLYRRNDIDTLRCIIDAHPRSIPNAAFPHLLDRAYPIETGERHAFVHSLMPADCTYILLACLKGLEDFLTNDMAELITSQLIAHKDHIPLNDYELIAKHAVDTHHLLLLDELHQVYANNRDTQQTGCLYAVALKHAIDNKDRDVVNALLQSAPGGETKGESPITIQLNSEQKEACLKHAIKHNDLEIFTTTLDMTDENERQLLQYELIHTANSYKESECDGWDSIEPKVSKELFAKILMMTQTLPHLEQINPSTPHYQTAQMMQLLWTIHEMPFRPNRFNHINPFRKNYFDLTPITHAIASNTVENDVTSILTGLQESGHITREERNNIGYIVNQLIRLGRDENIELPRADCFQEGDAQHDLSQLNRLSLLLHHTKGQSQNMKQLRQQALQAWRSAASHTNCPDFVTQQADSIAQAPLFSLAREFRFFKRETASVVQLKKDRKTEAKL